MTDAHLDGCGNCGTLGLRIPDETGKWSFETVEDVVVCCDEQGTIVHYRGCGE